MVLSLMADASSYDFSTAKATTTDGALSSLLSLPDQHPPSTHYVPPTCTCPRPRPRPPAADHLKQRYGGCQPQRRATEVQQTSLAQRCCYQSTTVHATLRPFLRIEPLSRSRWRGGILEVLSSGRRYRMDASSGASVAAGHGGGVCPTGHLQSACALHHDWSSVRTPSHATEMGGMARSRRGAEGLEARKLGRRRRWATSCRGHCVLRVSSAGAT